MVTNFDLDSQNDPPVLVQAIHPDGLVIMRIPLSTIKTVMQRALNTWPDAPEELFTFSDQLDHL